MELEVLLKDEIKDEFEALKEMEMGSDEYKASVDGLTKLVDRSIEIRKLEAEAIDKAAAREMEQQLKEKAMDEEKKDRRWKNGIAIGGIGLPLVVTIWGTLKTLKFEETGSVTTNAGRGYISKLFKGK